MRALGFLVSALTLAGCNVSYSNTASLPTVTVSGPPDQVTAFTDAQTRAHPDLTITRSLGGPEQASVTFAIPNSVSRSERAEMVQRAIAARLTVEAKA